MQEGARKDVERKFGVLQVRSTIVQNPCRLWDMSTISNIIDKWTYDARAGNQSYNVHM